MNGTKSETKTIKIVSVKEKKLRLNVQITLTRELFIQLTTSRNNIFLDINKNIFIFIIRYERKTMINMKSISRFKSNKFSNISWMDHYHSLQYFENKIKLMVI